jgi:hypothetical protein
MGVQLPEGDKDEERKVAQELPWGEFLGKMRIEYEWVWFKYWKSC